VLIELAAQVHDDRGDRGEQARVVLEQAFPDVASGTRHPPAGFPQPDDSLGITTFFTELVKQPKLRDQIWPEDASTDFQWRFRRREQRRTLLSGLARLGASYIDLYLLAIRRLPSLDLRAQAEGSAPQTLAREFVGLLLEQQDQPPGFNAFYELSQAAATIFAWTALMASTVVPSFHASMTETVTMDARRGRGPA